MKLILKVCLVTTEAFHQVMPLYQKLFCPKAVENLGLNTCKMFISSSRVRMPTPKLYGWMYYALSPINGVGDTWRKVLIVLSGVHEATSSASLA